MELLGWEKSKFIIDGFPRNQENFDVWQKIMGNIVDFRFLLYLECSFETMIKRVKLRAETSKELRSDDNDEVL